jgi:hypothetical protein
MWGCRAGVQVLVPVPVRGAAMRQRQAAAHGARSRARTSRLCQRGVRRQRAGARGFRTGELR